MSTITLKPDTFRRRAGAGWLSAALATLLLAMPVQAAPHQGGGSEEEAKALAEARDMIGRSEWQKAAERLRASLDRFPKGPQTDASLYWYAFSLSKMGRVEQSLEACARLLAEHEASKWARDARALEAELEQRLGRRMYDDPEVRRSDDDELKIIALQGLFETNPQRALAIAADLVKPGSKATPAVRTGALMMLGQVEDPRAVDLLLATASSGETPELRRTAILGLSQRLESNEDRTPDARVVGALREMALTSTDEDMARTALLAVSRDRSPGGRQFIEQVATSGKSPDLRQHAILMLGEYDDDASVAALIRIYDANVDTEVARFAVIALSQSKRPKAADKLMQIFRTAKDADVRRMALMQLAEEAPEKALDTLWSAYQSETEPEMKLGIIDAIAQMDTPLAKRKLIEIARTEKSHELRRRAVFWLAESDDPEAARYLEELLKGGE